jgi:hypothetical protein
MRSRESHFTCRHCHQIFVPDYRNRHHQLYCCQNAACRRASKQASQRRWCRKPENRGYFAGAERVHYVQAWRRNHPRYWRGLPARRRCTLQEHCDSKTSAEIAAIQGDDAGRDDKVRGTLQDLCRAQTPLLVGLIAQIQGTLQEDIESSIRRLIQRGQEILGQMPRQRTDQRYETSGSNAAVGANSQLLCENFVEGPDGS